MTAKLTVCACLLALTGCACARHGTSHVATPYNDLYYSPNGQVCAMLAPRQNLWYAMREDIPAEESRIEMLEFRSREEANAFVTAHWCKP